jgi:hypothetical protein
MSPAYVSASTGFAGNTDGETSLENGYGFSGEEGDTFEKFGYAEEPVAVLISPDTKNVTAITPGNPFATPLLAQAPARLAARISTLLDDPEEGTENARALLSAATGRVPSNTYQLSAKEREALAIVQAVRQLDTSSKLSLVSQLSGGSTTIAGQLAAQALQQNTPVGLGDFISAWRTNASIGENRSFSEAMSALGTALLALQIVAPAGMVSPSLMNGVVNASAALIL